MKNISIILQNNKNFDQLLFSNHNKNEGDYNLQESLEMQHLNFSQFHQYFQNQKLHRTQILKSKENQSPLNQWNNYYNNSINNKQHLNYFISPKYPTFKKQSITYKSNLKKQKKSQSQIFINQKIKTIDVKDQPLQKQTNQKSAQIINKVQQKNKLSTSYKNYNKRHFNKKSTKLKSKTQLSFHNQFELSKAQYKYFKQYLQKPLSLQEFNQYQNQSVIRNKSFKQKNKFSTTNSSLKKRPFSSINCIPNYQYNQKSTKNIVIQLSNPQTSDQHKSQFRLQITTKKTLKKILINQALGFGQIEYTFFTPLNCNKFVSKPLRTVKNKLKSQKYQKVRLFDQTKAIIGNKIL